MQKKASRVVLAENILKLMAHRYGGVNLTRLGAETKIKMGGAQRITTAKNVGPDLVDRVARKFGLEAWMLYIDGFDPENPPMPYATMIDITNRMRQAFPASAEAEEKGDRTISQRRTKS